MLNENGYEIVNPFDYGMEVDDVLLILSMRHPIIEISNFDFL